MKDIQALKKILLSSKKIVITTHANPDADALGSSLGLYHFLVQMGHQVNIIVPNSYPAFLEWMPNNSLVINYEKSKVEADELIHTTDLLFCLDFSGYGRIKEMKEVVQKTKAKIVLIDHHLNPEIKPDFNFWNPKAAATSELIFDLIVDFNNKDALNKNIAECLYAGILTDTGSFKHASTTSKVHRTVANLIDAGADINKVSKLIYDTNSLHRLKFIGHALTKKLKVNEEVRVAYFVIDQNDFKSFNLKQGDTEGLVNYALSIKDIAVAAIIIEREKEIKLSFRSINNFDVNTFAKKYFNGGGHKNAAGGISALTLKETELKFKELINKNTLKTQII